MCYVCRYSMVNIFVKINVQTIFELCKSAYLYIVCELMLCAALKKKKLWCMHACVHACVCVYVCESVRAHTYVIYALFILYWQLFILSFVFSCQKHI